MPPWSRRIRAIRLEAGLSQQQLAARAHVSVITVRDCERGGNPTVRSLESLGWALACGIEAFFRAPHPAADPVALHPAELDRAAAAIMAVIERDGLTMIRSILDTANASGWRRSSRS